MAGVYALAALWLGLVFAATLLFERQFGALQARAANAGIEASFVVAVGHPAEQIVHYAQTHDIDPIVLGHRGRSFLARWLIGSVSKQVIDYAHCSATVVR